MIIANNSCVSVTQFAFNYVVLLQRYLEMIAPSISQQIKSPKIMTTMAHDWELRAEEETHLGT